MKKILYLHGLESSQGGPKVDFLSTKGEVCAPAMNYRADDLNQQVVDMMEQFEPNLIIGSSMGGYVADILGVRYDIQTLLFNPALHGRSFEPTIDTSILTTDATCVTTCFVLLGLGDLVINPETTEIMLAHKKRYILHKGAHGHRTSLDLFMETYNKLEQYF